MISPLFDLRGKVAIITGSSRGLGLASAQGMAAHGAKVVISGRKLDACEAAAAGIREAGGEAIALSCNIGRKDELQRTVDAALQAWGRVDIVMANAAYARLIGRRVEDIVGQPCYRASRGRSEPCPATLVHCPLVECRRTGAAVRAVMDFTAADGQRVDVELDAAPVRDPQNRWQVVEVIRPLQERVRFSQEQRLSAIGLLANGVAHEIHNPLASIRLALQSCLRGLADGGLARDELEHYLRVVDQQIDRCVHITQRLMRLSEPSSETPLPVSVSSAVDDVLTVLGEEFRRAAVRVHVDLREPGLRALGDEGELRQVLVNVLQNSVHAMPHGGDVHISAWREEGQVHMSVQDSGVGIKSERLALIFLPFYSRRADGQHGTGLGLAICKSLLEQRGGWIRAHSTPGHGTRIEWALPDADARAQERKP
jgi:signal transduction histidine kinase